MNTNKSYVSVYVYVYVYVRVFRRSNKYEAESTARTCEKSPAHCLNFTAFFYRSLP